MTRRPALLAVLLAALAVLLVPGTASATTAGDVANELRTTPVYVDRQATVQIDEGRVLEAIQDSGQPIYVAVVPSQAASANGGPDALVQRIKATVREQASPRHVPDEVLAVPAVPHTATGKKLEVPLKRIAQGVPVEKALNLGSVDDPGAVQWFVEHLAARRA